MAILGVTYGRGLAGPESLRPARTVLKRSIFRQSKATALLTPARTHPRRLAVNREAVGPNPLRYGGDRAEPRGPVVSVAAVEPHCGPSGGPSFGSRHA